MKRFGFFMSLLVASSFFLAGCGSSSTVVDTQTVAIEKIGAYAGDQTQPVPTVEDYEAAGVEGVTVGNLDDINALVAELTAAEVDSEEKIQAILDEYNLSITDPEDTVAPVITVTGANPTTVTQGATYTDAGATATDNVDTTVTVITSGDDFDTSVLGANTVTYTATDAAGNTATATRTVTVVASIVDDTEAPVITVTGANPTTVTQGATYTDAGATATDNVDTTVTVITSGDDFDTSVLGANTVTYTATDAAGNIGTATRTVTVVASIVDDTEAPVITVTGANPTTVTQGATYTDAGATATDNVDTTVTVITSGDDFDTSVLGANTVTYTATDAAGNIGTATRTVTVVEAIQGDVIVGQTIEFSDVADAKFSFYQNSKYVKTICAGDCSDGTGTFDSIGTWSGTTDGNDASGLTLDGETTITTITKTSAIYHFPVIDNKDLPNNVQGDGIREKHANGSITFVYFRDPDAWGDRAFSGFGFDTVAWATSGGGGHWEIRDGKVYAFNGIDVTSEIATYAFDRQPVKDQGGPIVTVTENDGDLVNVIVVDEYWQLKPPATIDKTVQVANPAVMTVEAVAGKLMLITDKADGPSACYFETPLEVGVNGFVVCAGVSIDGTALWGGRGDNWYINTDDDLEMKLHELSPEPPSTVYTWRFEDANPAQGTLVSLYDSNGVFDTTSSLSRFQDF